MKQFEQDSINDILTEVNTKYNETIKRSNTVTTTLYNSLVKNTETIQNIKKKVAILGDMITDLKVLTGNTKTSVYLDELDIVEAVNTEIKNGRIELALTSEEPIEYVINSSSILSEKPYTIEDSIGNTKSINELFRYNVLSNLKVDNMGYDFTFELTYPKLTKVNQIVVTLPNDAISYPLIENIRFLDRDGVTEIPLQVLNNGERNYSFDENRIIGNVYKIDIEPIITRSISFTLSSRTDNVLSLISIKTFYNTYATSGYTILGPIVTDKPILKVGLSSNDSTNNVKLSISTDNESWVPVTDSYRSSIEKTRKIVAFNTINDASFKSDEDIRRLFIKIELESEQLLTTVTALQAYDNYREDSVLSNTQPIERNRISVYRQKLEDFSYGKESFASSANLSSDIKQNIQSISLNGITKVQGYSDTYFSIGNSNTTYTNINTKLNPLRVSASSLIDATRFDAIGSNLYDIDVLNINEEINTLTRRDMCFKLIGKEDTYKLVGVDSKTFIKKDISKNFITDSREILIQVPKEDIKLLNSLGEEIAYFPKENHYLLKDGIDNVYFISLVGVLYNSAEVTNYKYNPLFPLRNLLEDEYGLEEGRIVLGRGSITNISGYRLKKDKVTTNIEINYQNGNAWERVDPLYTYFHEQIDQSEKEQNVIKLSHRSIEKGSLQIYEYNEYDNVKKATNDIYIAVENTQS